jgi:two-component sensor histidine kinase
MNPKKHIVYLIICYISSLGQAQIPDFTSIKTDDGLSGNFQWSVNSVARDHKGFVWFITMGGLNRWDGYSVKSYTKVSSSNRDLPNNQLSAIAIDKNDNLWLGTQDEGIIFFDTKKETFTAFDFRKVSKVNIDFKQINTLHVDRNNKLFILTGFQGLYTYDIDKKILDVYSTFNTEVDNSASYFTFIDDNKLLVAASKGIYLVHSKEKFDYYPKPYEYFVRSILPLTDGTYHIFLQNSAHHYILNTNTKSLRLQKNREAHIAINGFVDQKNNLWISYMDCVLTKENVASGAYDKYPFFTELYGEKVPVGMIGILNSVDNKTYFMSLGSGAGMIDHREQFISPFLSKYYGNFKIINNNFYASKGSSIYTLDKQTWKPWIRLEERFSNHYIVSYHLSPMKGVFVSHCGQLGALSHFDALGKLQSPGIPMHCSVYFNQVENDSLCWETNSNVPIGSPYPIKFVGNYFTQLSGKKISDFKLRHYTVLKNGDIWMATFKDGIYRVYNDRKQYETFNSKNSALKSDNIYYILEHSNGDIYVSTDVGVHIWSPSLKTFRFLNLPENLSSSQIYGMIEDKNNNIWFLLKDRFLGYNTSTHQMYTLTIADYYKVEVENELQMDKNGMIYYQGYNGIHRFNPDLFLKGDAPNDVIFTDLFVKRNRVYPGDTIGLLNSSIMNQNTLVVPYKHRDLGFSFISIDGKENDLTYYYKLSGYNEDWIATTDERTIHFTNIDAGDYTFEVKALSGNGKETKHISKIKITVLAPWYQKWYAYVLYTFVLSCFLYLIYRYRINQLLKYQALRTKISSDLHDDVGTILTGIAMQSEMMSYEKSEQDKTQLLDLSGMSRNAMERMRDIVWALDSRKDSYDDLIIRMKEYAETMLSTKNLTYQFDVNISIGLSDINPEQRQNIYFIFKEAIANIRKHSNANHVHISISRSSKNTEISIKDNGTTIQKGEYSGQGLINMAMRAKKIHAQISIETHDGFTIKIIF